MRQALMSEDHHMLVGEVLMTCLYACTVCIRRLMYVWYCIIIWVQNVACRVCSMLYEYDILPCRWPIADIWKRRRKTELSIFHLCVWIRLFTFWGRWRTPSWRFHPPSLAHRPLQPSSPARLGQARLLSTLPRGYPGILSNNIHGSVGVDNMRGQALLLCFVRNTKNPYLQH